MVKSHEYSCLNACYEGTGCAIVNICGNKIDCSLQETIALRSFECAIAHRRAQRRHSVCTSLARQATAPCLRIGEVCSVNKAWNTCKVTNNKTKQHAYTLTHHINWVKPKREKRNVRNSTPIVRFYVYGETSFTLVVLNLLWKTDRSKVLQWILFFLNIFTIFVFQIFWNKCWRICTSIR